MMAEVDCSVLQLFLENLDLVGEQLASGETDRAPDPEFSLDSFWDRIVALSKSLSAETTKVCLGFSSTPLPGRDEQSHFTGRMQQMILALVSAFYGLPKSCGLTLRKSTRLALCQVVSSLRALLASVVAGASRGSSLEELISTAEFWSCCEAMTTLPRTNAAALRVLVEEEKAMALDALREIGAAREDAVASAANDNRNEDYNEDIWSERDLIVVSAASALVKTAGFVLKKMGSPLKRPEMSADDRAAVLDDLAEIAKGVSPAVDDLVLSLYPPTDYAKVERETKALHRVLRDLLDKCKGMGFCEESERNWISFLSEAADHNKTKTLESLKD